VERWTVGVKWRGKSAGNASVRFAALTVLEEVDWGMDVKHFLTPDTS